MPRWSEACLASVLDSVVTAVSYSRIRMSDAAHGFPESVRLGFDKEALS
jgi:hypothetical protein